MKVWGLRTTCHTYNALITRSLEILFLAALILPSRILFPVKPYELIEIISTKFDPEMPGLRALVSKIRQEGFAFEAEMALLAAEHGEKIIGFDLDITFLRQHERVFIDGEITDLRTTEFDIVTDTRAIECKSGHSMKSACNISQFIKEKTMIAWCKELAKELGTGELALKCMLRQSHQPCIVMNGPATCYKDVPITSSWFTSRSPEVCVDEFKRIINVLATKKAYVCFKHALSPERARSLIYNDISFDDGTDLASEFSKLSMSDAKDLTQRFDFQENNDISSGFYPTTAIFSA